MKWKKSPDTEECTAMAGILFLMILCGLGLLIGAL